MIKIYVALLLSCFFLVGEAAFAQANQTSNLTTPNNTAAQVVWSTW